MHCRFCKTPLHHVFIDLFNAPASNSFLKATELNAPETYYPLKVYTCHQCFLVQVDEYKQSAHIFNSEYVYFSSYSTTWLKHCQAYANAMITRFGLHENSLVMEMASNDGYLLQYFKEQQIPVLGIEPTANTAKVAQEKGIQTRVEFFGTDCAKRMVQEGKKADVFAGNNVIAHVPDIVDIVSGIQLVLAENGVVTLEFPHVLQLIQNNQFDTIYHEHFSYLSFHTLSQIFESCGLRMFDVEEIPTHGGSLRIYAQHVSCSRAIEPRVAALLEKEKAFGIMDLACYSDFTGRAEKIKLDFLSFLIEQKRAGKKVAAYGAAAKGNTLMNYAGIKSDLIAFVADANPNKQNLFMPASHVPVVHESYLKQEKPDFVIIFPWNIQQEIREQLAYIRTWGGQFVIPIPELQIV